MKAFGKQWKTGATRPWVSSFPVWEVPSNLSAFLFAQITLKKELTTLKKALNGRLTKQESENLKNTIKTFQEAEPILQKQIETKLLPWAEKEHQKVSKGLLAGALT